MQSRIHGKQALPTPATVPRPRVAAHRRIRHDQTAFRHRRSVRHCTGKGRFEDPVSSWTSKQSSTGEYDYSCIPELTRETAARIPGAEAIIMDGIGHFPMSENPDRFSRYLLPVLERIAS